MKKSLIASTVKALTNISEQSASPACLWVIHQPKEPKALQKLKK